MKTIRLGPGIRLTRPTVVCLGFFDGVHIGHAQLIARAVTISAETGLDVCVHTFDRIPAAVLKPEVAVTELTPLAQKAALLENMGVDCLAVSRFEETRHLSAAAFFHEILLQTLRAQHIVAGFHHHFGLRGEGDAHTLEALCGESGVGLDIIAPVTLGSGELVSSTAIRKAVEAGDYAKASAMLGRPYAPGES